MVAVPRLLALALVALLFAAHTAGASHGHCADETGESTHTCVICSTSADDDTVGPTLAAAPVLAFSEAPIPGFVHWIAPRRSGGGSRAPPSAALL